MATPLDHDMPLMITFPSVKDQEFPTNDPHTTCQILIMADYSWFEAWREEPSGQRAEEYVALKNSFRDRAVDTLIRFFPQVCYLWSSFVYMEFTFICLCVFKFVQVFFFFP